MGRLIVDNDLIIKMNELYLQIGTYAGVSRALGGSPSASTVKKYIVPGYKPQSEVTKISFSWDDVPKAKDIELKYSDFGDLCELAATEIAEIEKLWEELPV